MNCYLWLAAVYFIQYGAEYDAHYDENTGFRNPANNTIDDENTGFRNPANNTMMRTQDSGTLQITLS